MTARIRSICSVLLAALLPAVASPSAGSDFPAAPTYATDVAPIVHRSCTECHRAGGVAPFSLETAEDLVRRGSTVLRAVRDGSMPPWFASPSEHPEYRLANDTSLSERDKAVLAAWLESETRPLGDLSKAPAPRGPAPEWRIGTPDLVIELPTAVEIRESGTMPYVNVRVPSGLLEDRFVRKWEVSPTARDVVHHVLVFAVPRGERRPADETRGFFAAYVPGGGMRVYDESRAKRLPAGSDFVFQLHYTPNGRATQDRTRLGLVFAPEPPRHEIRTAGIFDPRLDIPPNVAEHLEGASIEVPADVRLLSWMPHMHVRGRSFRAYVEDGGVRRTILDLPRYDFNWQLSYDYCQPIVLKAGTTLGIEAVFDNSSGNHANPDPSRRVRWGQQTTDEMLIGYVEYELVDGGAPLGGGGLRGRLRDRGAQFATLDEDGDGAIERGEGGALVARAFDAADADGDGRVSRAEFEAFVSRRRSRGTTDSQ